VDDAFSDEDKGAAVDGEGAAVDDVPSAPRVNPFAKEDGATALGDDPVVSRDDRPPCRLPASFSVLSVLF